MTFARPGVRNNLAKVRRRERGVIMTYPGLRFGNLLYFALQAHVRSRPGRPVMCLSTIGGEELASLTRLTPLFLDGTALRWTDERIHPPTHFFQDFGRDFTAEDLAGFLDQRVLSGLPEVAHPGGPDGITINVRRGDYYSVPDVRCNYGVDVPAYVRGALHRQIEIGGRASSVHVVSDDPQWCRDHLGWLTEYVDAVTFSDGGAGAMADFVQVATSRRLILTNSTFSYWAGYVSNRIHGSNPTNVVVPQVHAWATNEGRAWQHDPGWSVVPAVPVDADPGSPPVG